MIPYKQLIEEKMKEFDEKIAPLIGQSKRELIARDFMRTLASSIRSSVLAEVRERVKLNESKGNGSSPEALNFDEYDEMENTFVRTGYNYSLSDIRTTLDEMEKEGK